MKSFLNIESNLDSLKLKSFEKTIYENATEEDFIIPKAIPFKGINTDMLYIKNNSILFLKFMDTTEELFSFLDEEIIEIMYEEYNLLSENMKKFFPNINYNYIFVMPYIESIEKTFGYENFVREKIIFGENTFKMSKSNKLLTDYLSEKNNEVELSIFLLNICTEYFVFTTGLNLNKNFKKVIFSNKATEYKLSLMEEEQMTFVSSVNYGNHIIRGGTGTGKSSLLLSRVIKLSKIYPHHKFLLLTFSKQQYNQFREKLDLLYADSDNIELHTFSSFIFKVAKANKLVIDHNLLKKNYDKAFANIMKQIDNTIKNKSMFKGIFIDEGENFTEEEISLVHEFLYKTKNIFNVSFCKSYNINNNLNIFKCRVKAIEYEDDLVLSKNYRQSIEVTDFINKYCENSNNYLSNLRDNLASELFMKTETVLDFTRKVNIVRVEDLDDQINSVIWEVQHFVNDLGYDYKDIAIIYPYNKKKLKNGKVIYFQYMLRKLLEDAGIEYMYADDSITNITPRNGITISNIYSIKSLSFKAVVVCELEMLYNHSVTKEDQDYQINDFAGDLNKVYTAMTRAEKVLSIVISYTPENSDIAKILLESSK